MNSTVATGGPADVPVASPRHAAHGSRARASSARAWTYGPQKAAHPDHQQRRVARLGGARPSLDEAVGALFGGVSHQCLLCSGGVVKRPLDGALVCLVCESVLGSPDLPELVVLSEAA